MFEITKNNINLIIENKVVGYILFDEKEDYLVGSYVFVDSNERGKGYAGILIDKFVEIAKEKNKKIHPVCPVIKKNLESNYQEILK